MGENSIQSVDALIVSALSDIAPVWNAVKEENENKTVEETYFVFNYSTYGADYADDDPNEELHLIQVHLVAPLASNISGIIKQAKRALHDAGFLWPETQNASDNTGRHIVLETEYATGVDL